jgi:hypothetical protein
MIAKQTLALVALLFTALGLLAAGCTKEPPKAPEATPAPNMAPGQAMGMEYMKTHGGGAPAAPATQGGR